jgi:hypothetical protein
MKNDVTIKETVIGTITITAPEHLKEEAMLKYQKAKSDAVLYDGTVMRTQTFSDGFFLEVLFENEEKKEAWLKNIGVK